MNFFYYKNGYYLPCLLEAHDGPDKWIVNDLDNSHQGTKPLGVPWNKSIKCNVHEMLKLPRLKGTRTASTG